MSIRFLRYALLLALAAPVAGAQQGGHDQHAAKPALDSELAGHFKGIPLTDAQVKQVTEIKAKHHKAMDALKKNAADKDSPALKIELQKHMDAEHAEFLALLTPEQKKTFMENMKSHHADEAKAKGEKHDGMKHEGMDHGAKAAPKKP